MIAAIDGTKIRKRPEPRSFVCHAKVMKIRAVFPGPVELIPVNNIPNLFEERVADGVIIVFIVVEDAVAIGIDRSRKHKFDMVLEIHDIVDIGEKAIGPAGFVEDADIGWNGRVTGGFEQPEFGIGIEEFGSIVARMSRLVWQLGHILQEEPAVVGA